VNVDTGALAAAAAEWDADPDAKRLRWATPGELARAVSPSWVQTPALDLIDRELVRLFSEPGARLLLSMPPQEGKTSALQMGCLWALIRDPERRIGIVSYSQALAETSGRAVRNLITANQGQESTLDLGLRIARDNGAARRWQLEGHRGGCTAAGVESGLTGRPLEALVLDDPYADREAAESAWYRSKVWDWWQSVGSTRLAPGAPVCVVLTRWHHADIAASLVEAEDGDRWKVVNIPALADHKPEEGQADPLGREPGEWLQSARRRTPAEWEAIRIQAGSRTFNSLYQGRPSPDTGDVWKRAWWRRYTTPLWSQHPVSPGAYVVPEADEMVISVDAAFTDSAQSDFVVMQVWARRGADVFLLDQVHKRLSFTDTVVAFRALVDKWPGAVRRLVESRANGVAIIDLLRSRIGGIVPVIPTESKYSRASAVAPFIEAGNVFLPDKTIALFDPEDLIDEASAFPAGQHDDMVDAASQALAAMLLDRTGFAAWLDWAKRQGEKRAAEELAEAEGKRALPAAPACEGGQARPERPGDGAPAAGPEPAEDAPIEGVPLDDAGRRRLIRDAMWREQGWRW